VSSRHIPIAYVLELGGEEFLGVRDDDGGFRQIDSLEEIAESSYVEMFGPSLGLVRPCVASIVVDEETMGVIEIAIFDGQPGCIAINSSRGLTGTLLRQIPLASLVREAAMTGTVRVLSTDNRIFGARYVEGGAGFGQLHDDLQTQLAKVEEHGRRRVMDESFLKMVAHIYRTALRLKLPPAKHVGDMLGPTSPANARRWIAAARREGYLGPAPAVGRAGEVTQEVSVSS